LTTADASFQERREFFRLNFSTPLKFKSYSPASGNGTAAGEGSDQKGVSENISAAGILFHTNTNPPQLSSILWMHLDIRTLKICQEIENRALILKDGLLGRVVRVEENNNTFDVGVCFITKDQKNSREVQQILSEITAA